MIARVRQHNPLAVHVIAASGAIGASVELVIMVSHAGTRSSPQAP